MADHEVSSSAQDGQQVVATVADRQKVPQAAISLSQVASDPPQAANDFSQAGNGPSKPTEVQRTFKTSDEDTLDAFHHRSVQDQTAQNLDNSKSLLYSYFLSTPSVPALEESGRQTQSTTPSARPECDGDLPDLVPLLERELRSSSERVKVLESEFTTEKKRRRALEDALRHARRYENFARQD